MSKRQDERILVKDDSDLFQLVRQLTEEQPPIEVWDTLRKREPLIQVELPFFALLNAVDQLPTDKARLLYHRLEERLTRTMMSSP